MSFVKDLFGGGAERRAAEAQARGQTEGIEELRRQFDVTRADITPELEAGGLAREELLASLGLRGPEAEQAFISGFQESPGQVFLRERAERATLRSAAATGGLRGGNVLQELQRQAIGLSGQFLGERKERLAGVAGGGRQALGLQVGAGEAGAANIAQLLAGRGQTRASGILAQAEARRGGLGRLAGIFTGSGGLGKIASRFSKPQTGIGGAGSIMGGQFTPVGG